MIAEPEADVETNSILIAELELSSEATSGPAGSAGYWLHLSFRGHNGGREVGPFQTRLAAFDWLRQTYGGGA